MDVVNVQDVLDRLFPAYRSPARAADWDAVQNRLTLGSTVRGKVVALFQFGAFVDIDVGFPALILVVRLRPDSQHPYKSLKQYPAIGSTLEARVCAWVSPRRHIALTQLAREAMLGEC